MKKYISHSFSYMDNIFITYSSIYIDFIISMGMKNHETVIKAMNTDQLVKNCLSN